MILTIAILILSALPPQPERPRDLAECRRLHPGYEHVWISETGECFATNWKGR